MKLHHYLQDLFDLFFPNNCLACGEQALQNQAIVCFSCEAKLPKTNMHLMKENRFTDRFWGRVPLQAGTALYHFRERTPVQQLIHNLKYYRKPKIGVKLGMHYGETLAKTPNFAAVDIIVPVPLHPIKERKRGYNQSDQFAIGLSKSMEKPWLRKGLVRVKYGKSQARKNRMERFGAIMNTFAIGDAKTLKGKHVLLVDDVLTTGATMEACATKILEIPDTKISMATIAIAGTT